jgi:prepilin-type processing-associated H-X9-DG protein
LTHAGNGFSTDQFWPGSSVTYAQINSNPQWTETNEPNVARGGGQNRFYQTGVIYYRSEISHKRITDGSSNTYLVGEKFLSPDIYETLPTAGNGRFGDNQAVWCGFEWDNHRIAWHPESAFQPEDYQPRQDVAGVDNPNIYAFGSAHAGAMNMAMCDGSVQSLSYDIDRDTHRFLANRLDGQATNLNQ